MPLMLMFFRIEKRLYRLLILLVIVTSLGLLVKFSPRFHDANAMWRIYYWMMVSKKIFIKNFAILGNGFGVPYADKNIAYFLQVVHGATTKLGDGIKGYLIPFHNSFLTIAFHIGLLPSLLLYYPFVKFVRNSSFYFKDRQMKYLFICLIGLSVWCSFNVILELPHSSLFYWLIYFLALHKMRIIENA